MVSVLEEQLSLTRSSNETIKTATLKKGVLQRKSLLFDSREIMTITKDMAYSIGQKGLFELCKIDETFELFEKTIFSEASKQFEYYTIDRESKKKVQDEINKFLILLSPYVMIKSAMYCLEWLTYQYHIHELCWSYLIHSVFPYHDTKIFPRIVQLIDFDDVNISEKRIYTFLKITNKDPVPLPKKTMVSQVHRNPSLLIAVSNYVTAVTKVIMEYSTMNYKYDVYSVVFSFYSSLAYASINHQLVNNDKTVHIRNQLLYNVIGEISSSVDIIRCTNVLILMKIFEHTQLTDQQLDYIVKKILISHDLDMVNLQLLLKMCQTQKLFHLTSKNCNLLIKTNSLGKIHKRFPEANLSDIGVLIVDSIENFFYDSDGNMLHDDAQKTTINELAELFNGLKNFPSLISKLVDKLIQLRIESTSTMSKQLLIEVEKFLPNVVIEGIGKKLLEYRQLDKLDNYHNLYDLLSVCLTHDNSMSVYNVDSVNLPLLLCVYNSNTDVRKEAIFGIRDYIQSRSNELTEIEKDKIKEMVEFLIYKNNADIVMLVLSHLQHLTLFSELFNDTERINIFKYVMNCVLTSPDKWIEAFALITLPNSGRITTDIVLVNDCLDFSQNHATTVELITILVMMLKKVGVNDNIYPIVDFASNLLPQSILDIFRNALKKQLSKNVKQKTSDCYIFFKYIVKYYMKEYPDFIEFIMDNFNTFKPLSKYCCLCMIGIVDIDLKIDNKFQMQIFNDLNSMDLEKSVISRVDSCESWKEILDCMDVANYPLSLVFTVLQTILSNNCPTFFNETSYIIEKDDFNSARSILVWLLIIYQKCDQSKNIIKKWITQFFVNKNRFHSCNAYLKFIQLCFYTEYNDNNVELLIDFYELLYYMSKCEFNSEIYLTTCFLLLADHRVQSVREYVYKLSLKSSSVLKWVKFFDVFSSIKEQVINCPNILTSIFPTFVEKKQKKVLRNSLNWAIDFLIWSIKQSHIVNDACTSILSWIGCISFKKSKVTSKLLSFIEYIVHEAVESRIAITNNISSNQKNDKLNLEESFVILLASLFVKLYSSINNDKFQYYIDILFKWLLLPLVYSRYLYNELNEQYLATLNTSTIEELALNWLEALANNHKFSSSITANLEYTEILIKSLRLCPLDVTFFEKYIEKNDSNKIIVLLEVLQSKNSFKNISLLLPSLFKYIELLYRKHHYYKLQLVLNTCETILQNMVDIEYSCKQLKNKDQITTETLNISCLLLLLDKHQPPSNNILLDHTDDNIVDSDCPNYRLSVFTILKHLCVLMPMNVLEHLVTIFISLGNCDSDNAYTISIIKDIVKIVIPIILNSHNKAFSTNNTLLSVNDIIVSVIDAFPHIPQHRHLTLCSTLFDAIDSYDSSQKYAALFILYLFYKNHTRVQHFCVDFINSRPSQHQINILMQLCDYLIKISQQFKIELDNLSIKNDVLTEKTPIKRPHNTISALAIDIHFNDCQSFIRYTIVLLSFLYQITQHSNNICCFAYYSSYNKLYKKSNLSQTPIPPIYMLLEKIYVYSEVVNLLSSLIPIKFLKVFKHLTKQCNDCIANILNGMVLDDQLHCVYYMLSSSSSYARKHTMDHFIVDIMPNVTAKSISKTSLDVMKLIIEKLMAAAENIVNNHLYECSNEIEELQSTMCCIKIVVFRLFSSTTNSHTNATSHLSNLNDTFNRLIKFYTVREHIPINAFVTINLAVCELAAVLSVNIFTHLFPLLTTIIDLFTNQCTYQKSQNNIKLVSLWFEANITALDKLYSSLGNFFSSHLYDILFCVIESSCNLCIIDDLSSNSTTIVDIKRFTIEFINKISCNTDSRIYLPKIYQLVVDYLTKIHDNHTISQSINKTLLFLCYIVPTFIQHIQDNIIHRDALLEIYFAIFDKTSSFLVEYESELHMNTIIQINDTISVSFCEFILKHSENQSHQIITKFFQWTTSMNENGSNNIQISTSSSRNYIFYYTMNMLWCKLKSIMLLFFSIYFEHSINYLNAISHDHEINLNIFMTTLFIVESFIQCFNYDKSGFINQERIGLIVQPLIKLIMIAPLFANKLTSIPKANTFVVSCIAPAVSSLANCTKENKLYIVIQSEIVALLNSESLKNNDQIIIDILILLEHFYSAIGDLCTTLLPEISPIIMEIMDEGSPTITTQVEKLVSTIESITGESMDRYL